MVGVLGTGAFAVVYRAHDPALDVDVAIKLLAGHHAHHPEIRSRFIAEARTLQRLSDDRVVTVHDIGEFDGRPYIVMEVVDGGTLDDRLSDGRTLGTGDVEWLVDGLGAALVVVHAAGFVHRDIKPSNLLIRHTRDADQLVLGDFGLAREIEQRRLTVAAGADAYMAPEQRLPGAPVDRRADVYAASGVVGHATFGTDWRRILVPSGPHQVTALEPPGTEPLAFELRRGLSADPAERHASISEWAEAVRAAASDHAMVVESLHDALPRRPPVVRLVAGTLVVLAMVLAAATIAGPSGSGDDAGRRPDTSAATGEPEGPDIVGPNSVLVGDPATFAHADRTGVDYLWIVPSGSIGEGDTVTFTPSEAIDFEITLIETDRGVERITTRQIEVRTP